ncbi:MAG: hypothetical protein WBJ44_10625 [Propionicimonas sp.]
MPSFRASVAIAATHTGVAPPDVLEAARTAVGAPHHVEDAFLDVAQLARHAGLPRVTIRFLVPTENDRLEDAAAWRVGRELEAAVARVADCQDLAVLRRCKGRWIPLDP